MVKPRDRDYIRGTVTHVHDRRDTAFTIVLCIARTDDGDTEAVPITFSIPPPHEQADLPAIVASVKVGDEVGTWYVRLAGETPRTLMGRTLEIVE